MSSAAPRDELPIYGDVTPGQGLGARAPRARHLSVVGSSLSEGASGKPEESQHLPRLWVIAAIVRPNRVFRLRGTFLADIEHLDDGTVFVQHRSVPVHGYGPDERQAMEAFEEAFELQWENLVERPLHELTVSAKEMRELLRHAVADVSGR